MGLEGKEACHWICGRATLLCKVDVDSQTELDEIIEGRPPSRCHTGQNEAAVVRNCVPVSSSVCE